MNVIEQITELESRLSYTTNDMNTQCEAWETREKQALIDSYTTELSELKAYVNENFNIFGIIYE